MSQENLCVLAHLNSHTYQYAIKEDMALLQNMWTLTWGNQLLLAAKGVF